MHSPSEPRNPLEVVEEALAAIQDHEMFSDIAWVGRDDYESYCTHCGGTDNGRDDLPAHASNCPSSIARAALALLRKMRADAVVGWAIDTEVADPDEPYVGVCRSRSHPMLWELDGLGLGVTPVLLLPLPDSTEPADDD